MDVLCFEFATGGGGFEDPSVIDGDGPFLREGAAMLGAAIEDFQALPGVQVRVLRDRRLVERPFAAAEMFAIGSATELRERLSIESRRADLTFLIAPECGGALERFTALVESSGGRLACPASDFVRLASDKHLTARWLAAANVPTPTGIRLAPGARLPRDFFYPAVLKPVDGAGSTDVRLIRDWRPDEAAPRHGAAWRLERFHPGRAASVLVLGGRTSITPLPACWQHLSDDGDFSYLGGTTPIPEPWNGRAQRLAVNAAAALPRTTGYFGFDIVLGESADGREDVVIEANPRMTTSYVGLRQLVAENLLAPLLPGRNPGHAIATWSFRAGVDPIRFTTG